MRDLLNRMSRLKIEGQRDKLDYFPTLVFTFVFTATAFRTIFRFFSFSPVKLRNRTDPILDPMRTTTIWKGKPQRNSSILVLVRERDD